MTLDENKRLIEADFPLREVSEHSAREKNIRHGHISTLHIWWARRLWLLLAPLPWRPSSRTAQTSGSSSSG
jgi:hypothetical protein